MFDQDSRRASVWMVIDAAIARVTGNESRRYLEALTNIGNDLAPHQRSQWNKSLEEYVKMNGSEAGKGYRLRTPSFCTAFWWRISTWPSSIRQLERRVKGINAR